MDPQLLSLQHAWSVGFLSGSGDGERGGRSVLEMTSELLSISRFDLLSSGRGEIFDDTVIDRDIDVYKDD